MTGDAAKPDDTIARLPRGGSLGTQLRGKLRRQTEHAQLGEVSTRQIHGDGDCRDEGSRIIAQVGSSREMELKCFSVVRRGPLPLFLIERRKKSICSAHDS
jgi:hypothetical protein